MGFLFCVKKKMKTREYCVDYTDLLLVHGVKEKRNELRHDKTKNVAVRPAKTQISLGIHPV